MSKASTTELDALHKLIADKLADKLRSGDFTAADLNVARQFLKDNGIEAQAVPGTPLDSLRKTVADGLPFPTEGVQH